MMPAHVWLALIAAWAAPTGGLAVWVFSIRERASQALAETEKNKIRIEQIHSRLVRGDSLFDALREDMAEVKQGMARIEERIDSINNTLQDILRKGT